MKIPLDEFTKTATLIRDNDKYKVYDLCLEKLVISMTILYDGKSTVGHSHIETEEIYLFIGGNGEIQLGDKSKENVSARDIILIPSGVFHRVFNEGKDNLVFFCFLRKYKSFREQEKT